jgi:hypothetical protein
LRASAAQPFDPNDERAHRWAGAHHRRALLVGAYFDHAFIGYDYILCTGVSSIEPFFPNCRLIKDAQVSTILASAASG